MEKITLISEASLGIVVLHHVAGEPLIPYCQEIVHSLPLHRSFSNEQN